MIHTDVLIIGCGIAGASAALRLARNPQRQITIITRASDPRESNTRYAQGGIVARGPDDSVNKLTTDILESGAGANSPEAVEILAKEGPDLVHNVLIELAHVTFDKEENGEYAWGKEAAHSTRRILHKSDFTGKAIIDGLIKTLLEYPNVNILTETTAVDLITFPHHSNDPLDAYDPITCHGAYAFFQKERTIHRLLSQATILASGGLGRIFRSTTNPIGSRGDGVAMAHRAGARIINAEYVQFHPTALAVPGAEGFLISEAVRGEGGILLSPDGEPFMEKYSPEWKDLAPRDVVARAIHFEMEKYGYSHVLLNIAAKMPASMIRERFPNIYDTCLKVGLDITQQPIPVIPAAHYFCGGVLVNSWGQTNIKNLYAIGEVSCTGLHGANRLASTSLLEGLVWGNRAAQHIERSFSKGDFLKIPNHNKIPRWDESGLITDVDLGLIQGDMQTIQNIMYYYVGLVRNIDRLTRAIRELRHLWNEVETFYRSTKLDDGLIGLRNAVEVASLVAQAALHNRTSRGCHYWTEKE